MSWFLSFVLAGTASYGSAVAPVHVPALAGPVPARSAEELLAMSARRIRSSERRLTKLLVEGVRRSKTFADLVARIHDTDLIVYVESTHQLAPDTLGRVLIQGAAGGQRYLRVQVRAMLHGDQIIAVLGHELHHVLEVAGDRSVVDEPSLSQLYRRIGRVTHGSHAFDTDGARITGIRVRFELIG